MTKPWIHQSPTLLRDARGICIELHRDKVLTDYQFSLFMAAFQPLPERDTIKLVGDPGSVVALASWYKP